MRSISVSELANQLERRKPLRLLDVRRAQALAASGVQIAGAQWKDPALWLDWKDEIAHDLPIVVYCAHGHEISQGLTATLQAMGADACHLEGGISAWQAQGQSITPVQMEGSAAEVDLPQASQD
ncbi:Rhodanese-like [Rhodoferax ferrireducens T118]|uniref:Rhodanese-like n=1 Tax=Albidiferax ferrireducens (strain ATCC BAA-621 / DSM 15236 / T118) TaxID=338969 RepID=Q21VN8_ALBFT|nr:rhodanese-like domain-containing protein [Rhodoferax ferrireducens]ABD70165.1 Rhodanese-like [Rhodoferax ferrireducens T118]WPC65335.1 rhodanese-like domain-containing protein [Rhodoferax ferrireducens]